MVFDHADFQAALLHEVKNHLGLLGITLENVPLTGDPAHDAPLDEARMLCQSVADRLRQALWLYKSNQGLLTPDIDAYSPHDLLDAVAARAKALSRGRFVVDTRLSDSLPAIAFFDRDLIEMALITAIQNSLHHARTRIGLAGEMRDGWLQLTVHDDSDGYPPHVLENLAAGTAYRSRGTGLGLQFARLIAQLHENKGRRGTLVLQNEQGAVFTLMLP